MLKRFLSRNSFSLNNLHRPIYSQPHFKFSSQPENSQKEEDIKVHEVQGGVQSKEDAIYKPYIVKGESRADDNECLIDVDNFDTKKYLLSILNPWAPPDPKNFFPFWVITTYIGVGSYYFIQWLRKKMGIEKTKMVIDPAIKEAAKKGQAEGSMFGLGERASIKFDFKNFETNRDKIIRSIADD